MVENFSIPNGGDGTKQGLDKYSGKDALMLDVWNDRASNQNGNLSNAHIYRKVKLQKGLYYFGAGFNANYGLTEQALLCPMIDARRMEVYCALYDRALKEKMPVQPVIVDETFLADTLDEHPVYFFGNGSDKCKTVLTHPNAHFIDDIIPHAKNMCPLAEMAFLREEYQDVAYFEPFYLKEFQAKVPKSPLAGL